MSENATQTPVEEHLAPHGPSPEEMKLLRRKTRRQSLFDPELLKSAAIQALIMLRPDRMWKNPVMFVVEVGTALSIVYTVIKVIAPESTQATLGYLIALD